jgi:hypothetical protein
MPSGDKPVSRVACGLEGRPQDDVRLAVKRVPLRDRTHWKTEQPERRDRRPPRSVDVAERIGSDQTAGTRSPWTFFVIILPFLGIFIYLIAEGKDTGERNMQRARDAQATLAGYVQLVAGKANSADQIAKAKELLDSGTLTQAEFDQLKAKALAA